MKKLIILEAGFFKVVSLIYFSADIKTSSSGMYLLFDSINNSEMYYNYFEMIFTSYLCLSQSSLLKILELI